MDIKPMGLSANATGLAPCIRRQRLEYEPGSERLIDMFWKMKHLLS